MKNKKAIALFFDELKSYLDSSLSKHNLLLPKSDIAKLCSHALTFKKGNYCVHLDVTLVSLTDDLITEALSEQVTRIKHKEVLRAYGYEINREGK